MCRPINPIQEQRLRPQNQLDNMSSNQTWPTKKGIIERQIARKQKSAFEQQNEFSSSNPDWVPGVKEKSLNHNNGQTHGSATASIHD